MTVRDRLAHAWNAFVNVDRSEPGDYGPSYGSQPDRRYSYITNDRSIVNSVFTRMAVDAASVDFRHVRLDDQGRYMDDMESGLQECLTVESNLDQIPLQLFIDAFLTMFDRGHVAVVPVETTLNPNTGGGWDIKNLRAGEVVQWFPDHVKVNLYNEKNGRREEVTLPKRNVAIVPNPFYSSMNSPNSTMQRLIAKLRILDDLDQNLGSKKLDLIIQLPFQVKTETKRAEAAKRIQDIQFQLSQSQMGIAYADATEKVTQLNRPVENNLLPQIEYLVNLLFGQFGLTPEIMNGTADEKAMLNYHNRTIGPVLDAMVGEMKRKFLSKTARTQKQSIVYYRDPFKLVPLEKVAEIADKLTRNEILSSNEFRGVLGFRPVKDAAADQLRNSNMPVSDTGVAAPADPSVDPAASGAPADSGGDLEMSSEMDGLDQTIAEIEAILGTDANANG